MGRTMVTRLNGTDINKFLTDAAKRRAELIDEANQIEQDVFLPMNLDPDKFLANPVMPTKRKTILRRKSTGPRAKKGEQTGCVLDLIKSHDGTIMSKEVQSEFTSRGYRTNAAIVLARMAEDGIIQRQSRGVYQLSSPKKAKASKVEKAKV